MITINLLPVEFRRKVEQQHVVSPRFGLILTCFVSILIWIGLSFMHGTAKREVDNLSSDWTRLETGAKEADKIMLEINQGFLDRKRIVDAISTLDMSWANVLNKISDGLPDSAWLRKVKLSSNGMEEWEFWIKGMVRPTEAEPPIKVVGKYMSALKPSLEQPVKIASALGSPAMRPTPAPAPAPGVAPGQAPPVDLGKFLTVQTSTGQETINNVMLTSFEGTFTLKAKKDESLRNRPKTP